MLELRSAEKVVISKRRIFKKLILARLFLRMMRSAGRKILRSAVMTVMMKRVPL